MIDVRLGRIDKIILTLSLIGALVTGYAVVNEHLIVNHFVRSKSTSKPIARVASAENDVRRRMGQSILWYQVGDEEVLFENDSLYTGQNSQTSIAFGEDAQVNLGPNSLILLQTRNKELQIDLQIGTVVAQLERGQRVNVVHQGELARIEAESPNTMQVIKSDEGKLKLSSLSGGAKVKVRDSIQKIEANEEVEVDQGLKVNKKRLNIIIQSPAEGEEVWLGQDETVRFQWRRLDPNGEYAIQVARDRAFRHIVFTEKTISDSYGAKDLTPNQPYYWRMGQKVDGQWKTASRVGFFRLYDKSAPQPIFPTPGWSVEVEDQAFMRFKWSRKSGADKYLMQVASDPDFNEIVVEKASAKNYVEDIPLGPGSYHWRVKAEGITALANLWGSGGGFDIKAPDVEPVSEVAEIPTPEAEVAVVEPPAIEPEVEKLSEAEVEAETPVIEKPQLQLSTNELELKFKEGEGRDPASVQQRLMNPPKLSWSAQGTKDSTYVVEVSDRPDFSKKLLEKRVKQPEYVWRSAQPGDYFWRVRHENKAGGEPLVSEAAELKVRLPSPAMEPAINSVSEVETPAELNKMAPVEVEWGDVPMANGYHVLLSKDPNFVGRTVAMDAEKPRVRLRLKKPGAYYMKVAAKGKTGEKVSAYSPPTRVDYDKKLILQAPGLELPGDGTTLVAFPGQEMAPVAFSWDSVPHAKKYRVQLARDSDFSQMVKEVAVSQTSWVFGEKAPEGVVYWRVRAEYGEFSSDWSRPRTFETQIVKEKQ